MPELLNEETREQIFNEICSEVFPKEFYEYLLKKSVKEILERTEKPLISPMQKEANNEDDNRAS